MLILTVSDEKVCYCNHGWSCNVALRVDIFLVTYTSMSLSVPFVGVGFSTFNPISHRLYPSNAPFLGWTRSHTQVHFTFRLNLIVDFLPPSFRRCCLFLQFHSRKFTFLSVFGESGIPGSGHIHFGGDCFVRRGSPWWSLSSPGKLRSDSCNAFASERSWSTGNCNGPSCASVSSRFPNRLLGDPLTNRVLHLSSLTPPHVRLHARIAFLPPSLCLRLVLDNIWRSTVPLPEEVTT